MKKLLLTALAALSCAGGLFAQGFSIVQTQVTNTATAAPFPSEGEAGYYRFIHNNYALTAGSPITATASSAASPSQIWQLIPTGESTTLEDGTYAGDYPTFYLRSQGAYMEKLAPVVNTNSVVTSGMTELETARKMWVNGYSNTTDFVITQKLGSVGSPWFGGATAEDGTTAANQVLDWDGASLKLWRGGWPGDRGPAYKVTAVSVTTDAGGYAEAYFDFGFEIPAESALKAYKAVKAEDGAAYDVELVEIAKNATSETVRIPAGTPVILKGAAETSYALTLIPRVPENASEVGDNLLQGNFFSSTPAGNYWTLLSNGNLALSNAAVANNKVWLACGDFSDSNLTLVTNMYDEAPVDATIDVVSSLGTFYDASHNAIADITSVAGAKYWEATINLGVPNNPVVRISCNDAANETGIAQSAYDYTGGDTSERGLRFSSATEGEYKYTISVSGGSVENPYYILQYTLGVRPVAVTGNSVLVLSNKGGSEVTTKSATNRYNITDTPCDVDTWFQLSDNDSDNDLCAGGVNFKLRIVDKKYIDSHMEGAIEVVKNDLNLGVGFPKKTSVKYENLVAAVDAMETKANFTNYQAMLKAYSRYLSDTDVQMPEDCKVYTISVIDTDGSRWYFNQTVDAENPDTEASWSLTLNSYPTTTVETSDGLTYTRFEDNSTLPKSARYISHMTDDGKFIFVNRETGKYLNVPYTGNTKGQLTYFQANPCSFEISQLTQDLDERMASATDELLLGAVYLKAKYVNKDDGTPNNTDRVVIVQSSNHTFNGSTVPAFGRYDSEAGASGEGTNHFTSAIIIEEVKDGDTFNKVELEQPADGNSNYYATFYNFYPAKVPTSGVKVYYATESEKAGYLQLNEVTCGIIPPYTAVVIESESATLPDGHLHLAKMTEDLSSNFTGNVLQGVSPNVADEDVPSTEDVEGNVYALNCNMTEGLGFYPYNETKLPKGMAYYVSAEEITGYLLHYENGAATGIQLNNAKQDAVAYDLTGRKVSKAQNGLFIVNGQKAVVK